jgi:hypothetical protein
VDVTTLDPVSSPLQSCLRPRKNFLRMKAERGGIIGAAAGIAGKCSIQAASFFALPYMAKLNWLALQTIVLTSCNSVFVISLHFYPFP